ncbi:hypothetical protein [Streptomyces chartreusis]
MPNAPAPRVSRATTLCVYTVDRYGTVAVARHAKEAPCEQSAAAL